ncbi:YhgE/Pip domain-containing protein [Paenibacillus sp. OV219]|uniref:YhgE/Pip domain-containing protein n=1 Tax=Paenibacillus sp. OV219 TaxID=1884377 RepID=UPI0008D3CE49|nr:ABC transporter permease [Paenibacillus sp. OV219]SEN51334.1 YhgE/Pip N-terminal domain-containing protein [Paenibacillus sp. OV219]
MALFKQKTVWIGLLAVFIVLAVFGVAMMGSVLGAKPKELPVALVVEDKAVSLPNGSSLNVGDMVKEKLLANAGLPIAWHVVATEAEAQQGLDEQEYYGAFVLPADLSAGVVSLMSDKPKPATVRIVANEGMSVQASTAVKQMLSQIERGISSEMSQQVLGMVSQRSDVNVISLGMARALLVPFQIEEQTVHPIGTNNASGNAPGMLTQIMWIGSLVVSIILMLASQKAQASGGRRFGVLLTGAATGLVFVGLASGYLVWMSKVWYGMSLADATGTWLVLMLGGAAFFLLQSALLSWLGLPAMPVLILLMFFSLPVVNIAPEFLPKTTHDWLYVWTPFRFVAGELRNSMYFADVSVSSSSNMTLLWCIAAASLVVKLASSFRKAKVKAKVLTNTESA